MLDYYTLQATLDKLSTDRHTFTINDLATLCRADKLTPVFYYGKCLDKFDWKNTDYQTVEPFSFKGYLTSDWLKDFLFDKCHDKQHSIVLHYADVFETIDTYYSWDIDNQSPINLNEGDSVALFDIEFDPTDQYQITTHDIKDQKGIEVNIESILFPRKEVEALASDTQSSQPIIDKMHPRERDTAVKIMYALLLKNNLDNNAPYSQNAGRANCEIRTLLDQLGISLGHETIGKFLSEVKDLSKEYPSKSSNLSN